jgi:hypothetical protein
VKITDADIIKSGEKELIDLITADLDWNAIEKIFEKRHRLRITDDVQYKDGDIIVHDNQIAYKLDFNIKVTLSLLFDRTGEYLSFKTSADLDPSVEAEANADNTSSPLDVEIEQLMTEETETIEASGDTSDTPLTIETSDDEPFVDPEKKTEENISEMASRISGMISEINSEE